MAPPPPRNLSSQNSPGKLGLTLTWIYASSPYGAPRGMSSIRKRWGVLPWGHVYHLNNSESPTQRMCFELDESYFLGPPPPPSLGPPWKPQWTTLILYIWRYLNTTQLDCSTSGSEDVTLKFAWFWPLGALSLGPHGPYEWLWIPGP